MKFSGLLVAAILLAVLSGVLYWSNHRKPSEDAAVTASADAPAKIISLNQADIVSLTIRRKDQPEVALSRNESGAWQITGPQPLAADKIAVSSVLSTLSLLNSQRLVDEKASDLEQFGLANPALEVDVSLKGGKTQKLLVGNQTPAGDAYYVMLAGDPRLFTFAGYSRNSLDKTVNDLRDKRLLTADFDKISEMELISQKPDEKQDLTFARDKDLWQITKPALMRVDNGQVDELLRLLREAKIDTSPGFDDRKNATAFRAANPIVTARITGTFGTQDLEVRKNKDLYYAKSSALAGVYQVPVALGAGLDKSLNDFRNKKLFDFGYQDPDKIQIRDGAKSYFLTHAGSDWWGADGKKLDEATVQLLLVKLRELSAESFPDAGFSTPSLEITVTSKGGQRTEQILIAKNGENYVAKRQNEPVLYEISGLTVTDVRKATADLKPAAESKK
ncbi:MAG: DUF4340 domain-containing protein [Candidatus Acidiferrum sp.]|jgi:hypothetical protein